MYVCVCVRLCQQDITAKGPILSESELSTLLYSTAEIMSVKRCHSCLLKQFFSGPQPFNNLGSQIH